jgi:uncharacterized membrane protein YbhN (UPF0104 family)
VPVDAVSPPQVARRWWLPLGDASRARRLLKVAAWLVAIALVVGALELAGVDVGGWFADLWDSLPGIPAGYLALGWTFQAAQTTLTALAWCAILRAGFPEAPVVWRQVLAAYAAGVALNGVLPAGTGSVVTLLMFVAMIPGATFAGVLGGLAVQKIFFALASAFVYVYLFATVPGTFRRQLRVPHDHPALTVLIAIGAAVLIVVLARILWHKLAGVLEKAKEGGAILGRPGHYLIAVVLPSFGAWMAKLAVTAVFLAAFGITVTFHSVMAVLGGNALAGSVSVTPGGVGVNQATNIAALNDVTASATATAYSLGQQLAITAFNIAFAVILVAWAFGWSGGKALFERSLATAKTRRAADQTARGAARRKRMGRQTARSGGDSGNDDS